MSKTGVVVPVKMVANRLLAYTVDIRVARPLGYRSDPLWSFPSDMNYVIIRHWRVRAKSWNWSSCCKYKKISRGPWLTANWRFVHEFTYSKKTCFLHNDFIIVRRKKPTVNRMCILPSIALLVCPVHDAPTRVHPPEFIFACNTNLSTTYVSLPGICDYLFHCFLFHDFRHASSHFLSPPGERSILVNLLFLACDMPKAVILKACLRARGNHVKQFCLHQIPIANCCEKSYIHDFVHQWSLPRSW